MPEAGGSAQSWQVMDVHPIVSGPFFGAQLAGRFLACHEVGLVAVSRQMLG
jgi:hypothetical protein